MSLYPSTIQGLHFYVLGDQENFINSHTEVNNKESIRQSQIPVIGGIYDPHMGTTENNWRCHTCFNRKLYCPGHEGHINLKYPVQNPIFKEEILQWLKIICFSCGGLYIDKPYVIKNIQKSKRLGAYVSAVRNTTNKNICILCGAIHPHVYRDKLIPVIIWTETQKDKPEKKRLFNHEISDIFQKISNDTIINMGKPIESHPKKFIISIMCVPPNTIRPDIKRIGGGRSNNNDLTILTKAIVEINNKLPLIIPDKIEDNIEINYTNLDMSFYELVKGSPGSSGKIKIVTNTNKPPGSLASRFIQKAGRIRRNLMGTRVGYSARTVISCDPMIRIDELGVPIHIAKSIQIPEIVNVRNKNRLMTYFYNKHHDYPGSTTLRKKRTGVEYWVGSKNRELVLEDGDTLMRDLIDGDVAVFNRQPTMLSSAMSCHKVRIMEEGNTYRLNISACVLYNADFDGDAMNLFFACSTISRNEIEMLSNVGSNFISKVDGSPLPGCFQDTLASVVELTHSDVKISKYRAMQIFKNVQFKLDKSEYTGRELISEVIPMINFETQALYYNEAYANYIKYKTNDIHVKIKQGDLTSGILDHKSCGQQRNKSIFHIIHNEYGPQVALDTLFNIQQIGIEFIYCKGFTVAVDEFIIPKKSLDEIHDKTSAMITEVYMITDKLKKGELVPPIGMTIRQYYEQLVINTLSLGDDFVRPVLSNVDIKKSGFYKMISMCKKGKMKNLQAVTSAMGSSLIDGKRATTTFGYSRTLPYFSRFDLDPIANGFIADSFICGISPASFLFAAQEARVSVINKSLSTSIPGQRSRESIKNLESDIANNIRQCVKNKLVVQYLYGGNGIDTRNLEHNILPTADISKQSLQDNFKCEGGDIPKKFRNKSVMDMLDTEFKTIEGNRDYFRSLFIHIECVFTDKTVKNAVLCPFNIMRIINNVTYSTSTRKELDVVKAYNQVNDFCNDYPYIYSNNIQKRSKSVIPERYIQASELFIMVIKAHLCVKQLINKNIDNTILSLILDKILIVSSNSLIDYGTPVGSLASQSLSEPMTQYIIDSHHRSGVSGGQADTQTDTLTRNDELMFAKETENMKNPTLTVFVKEQYEEDDATVNEIANHIESMRLSRFLSMVQIFFEEYGKPIHPDYSHEKKIIEDFEKHNPMIKIPSDLTRWVIRFEINKMEMVLKNMDLETVIFALMKNFPEIHFVYTHENSEVNIIRCYLRNTMFKKGQFVNQEDVEFIKDKLMQTNVRGIVGIEIARVTKKSKSYIAEDGSLKSKKINIITTNGTNFMEIMQNPYLETAKCQSDSIKEIEELFGIEAARQKLRSELERVSSEMGSPMSAAHYSLFCDELCITGKVRGISKTGLEIREPNNILLRTSYSHMNQVLKSAAGNGNKTEIYGLSGPLMIGQTPRIGSTYNSISIDHDFISREKKSIDQLFDEL